MNPHDVPGDICALLAADASLAAVVGGWHENLAPEDVPEPVGIVSLVVGSVERVYGGNELSWQVDVDVKIIDQDLSAKNASDIYALVHAVLENAAIGLQCRRVALIRYPSIEGAAYWHVGGTYRVTT